MAATRRDRNKNFIKWNPVEYSRFTPNAPLDWLYEISDPPDSFAPKEEKILRPPEEARNQEEQEAITSLEIANMTPTNAELLRLAELFPPPPEWFENDEERPF
jgi:hypothetical protein